MTTRQVSRASKPQRQREAPAPAADTAAVEVRPSKRGATRRRAERDARLHRQVRVRLPSLIVVIAFEWAFVFLAYQLGWSRLFHVDVGVLSQVSLSVVLGTWLGYYVLPLGGRLSNVHSGDLMRRSVTRIAGETAFFRNLWAFWLAAAALEIVIAGRLPLLDALRGQASNYREFGIPSVHGLLLALGCALLLIDQAVRLALGKNPVGPRTLVFVMWLILIVGRKQIVVVVLQLALLLIASGRVRLTVRQIVNSSVVATVFVFGFGFLGTLRSAGADGIATKLRFDGPSWIPDSFIWLYAYATTPIANLANAVDLGDFAGDGGYPTNTFGGLVPSFITGEGNAYDATAPWLVSTNFNVSTGYIGPLLDGGLIYIALYAVLIGLICGVLRLRVHTIGGSLAFIAAFQCAMAMMYANNFANLNNVAQIPILLLVAGASVRLAAPEVSAETAETSPEPAVAGKRGRVSRRSRGSERRRAAATRSRRPRRSGRRPRP